MAMARGGMRRRRNTGMINGKQLGTANVSSSHTYLEINIYICIYIYLYIFFSVCVCVCVCTYFKIPSLYRDKNLSVYSLPMCASLWLEHEGERGAEKSILGDQYDGEFSTRFILIGKTAQRGLNTHHITHNT